MLISNDEKLKILNIEINNVKIKHTKTIKILGTTLNDNLNFEDHVSKGNQSIIAQLKQRKNAIERIIYNCDKHFALQYANAIFQSKINYHIEISGACQISSKAKINNMLISLATKISTLKIGQTDEKFLKSVKWVTIEEKYRAATAKLVHKLLNNDSTNKHTLANKLIMNRSIRMIAENKCDPKPEIKRNDSNTSKTFTFRAIDIYNRIPRILTLLPNI